MTRVPRSPRSLLLALLSAVLGVAIGVPVAQAFFIDTGDQRIAVSTDRVANAVVLVTRDREPEADLRGGYAKIAGLRLLGQPLDVAAAHGSERSVAVVLGWRRDWASAPAATRAFTITSKTELAGITARVLDARGEPSAKLTATVSAVPSGPGGGPLATDDRRQVDLEVTGPASAGAHAVVVELRLAYRDGSFLTKRVPVVWFGGSTRPANAEILDALGADAPSLAGLREAAEREAAPARPSAERDTDAGRAGASSTTEPPSGGDDGAAAPSASEDPGATAEDTAEPGAENGPEDAAGSDEDQGGTSEAPPAEETPPADGAADEPAEERRGPAAAPTAPEDAS